MVVFELNSGNHAQRRALANAIAIGELQKLGNRLPVVCSANALQPDGQNDNGWDQGLLFLDPSQVWLQPPGYVTRMIARSYQPINVPVEVKSAERLDPRLRLATPQNYPAMFTSHAARYCNAPCLSYSDSIRRLRFGFGGISS